MPKTLAEIFNSNPEVEIIEIVGYDDGKPFGLSSNRQKLKIHDENFARQLSSLPGANTEAGHTTNEGYIIRGGFNINESSYKAFVYRKAPKP